MSCIDRGVFPYAILYLSEDIEICLENIENLSSATSKKGGNIPPFLDYERKKLFFKYNLEVWWEM